jgi:hypothetical protein
MIVLPVYAAPLIAKASSTKACKKGEMFHYNMIILQDRGPDRRLKWEIWQYMAAETALGNGVPCAR